MGRRRTPPTRPPHRSAAARGPTAALSAALVLATASACGTSGAGPTEVDEVATYVDDGSGMDALLVGALDPDDGCVYLASGEERVLPVFPDGQVTWDGETLTLRSEEYRAGDELETGGGVVSEPSEPRPLDEEWHVPAACATDFVWLVAP